MARHHWRAASVIIAASVLAQSGQTQVEVRADPGVSKDGGVVLRTYIVLSDSLTSYNPIARYRLWVYGTKGDSLHLTTDDAGAATVILRPGEYRLVSARPVTWHGARYSWNLPLSVRRGMKAVYLTTRNAEGGAMAAAAIGDTAGADGRDAAVAAWRDSVARAERSRELAKARETLTGVIYFAFNSHALSAASRAALDRKAAVLTAYPAIRIRIAGHADELGSDEYNFALGQRRAEAARDYLAGRGADTARLEIVSYGKTRPVLPGTDERRRARNRRAEFEIIAGAERLGIAQR